MTTNTPAPATQDPISEAILLLTEEADSLSDCHTRKPGDWAGEPEAKAHYDHVLAVIASLSKLRAPVADERAAFETFQRGAGLNELYLERHRESGQYMWTATKEAWETWQARAALASAAVAGEAQPVAEVVSRYGDPEAFGERDLKVLVDLNSYPYGAKFYAAPQASDAVRDAHRQHASAPLLKAARRAVLALAAAAERDAAFQGDYDALSAALSAQPGTQQDCNCATCRPHSVEMRMILCGVCGDKRCPRAADHRNECVGTGPQKGGSDA